MRRGLLEPILDILRLCVLWTPWWTGGLSSEIIVIERGEYLGRTGACLENKIANPAGHFLLLPPPVDLFSLRT